MTEATNEATNIAEADAAAPPTTHIFAIPNTDDTNMQIELTSIPDNVRLDMLKKAIETYVKNSVNQANIRHNKAMQPWTAYEKATAADAAQTVVAKPEGEQPTVDLIEVAKAARQRLYDGEVRKAGSRKSRKTVSPLVRLVTDAVVRELFEKKKETVDGYKWTDAVKEVSGDGIKYLAQLVDSKVAEGADRGELEKLVQARYVRPAELMLGQHTTKATEGDLIG